MAKNNNLQDFLTDVANSIRTKTGTTAQINAQDFSNQILNIPTSGGGTTLKNLLDATQSTYYMFINYTGTSVDDLIQPNDTENVTNMDNMFNSCSNLTTVPLLNTSKVTNMYAMFYFCQNLSTVPLFDTSNVTNMSQMFSNCTNLTTVPELDVSKVTQLNNIFFKCANLKSILMTNIGESLSISASTKFERSDLLVILNNLKTVTRKTLTMGATNLAKLTEEDKAIATNKGWTLA